MVIHIILDLLQKNYIDTQTLAIEKSTYLKAIDLILQTINILLRYVLAGNFSLNFVEPLVEIINVLRSLFELLLDSFL